MMNFPIKKKTNYNRPPLFNGRKRLRNAAKLYELAYNLQRDEAVENKALFTFGRHQ